MKLRYKKIILLVLISTIGIGGITLSMVPNHHVKESMNQTDIPEKKPTHQAAGALTTAPTIIPTSLPGMTATPTVAPADLPVYALESEGYPKITNLMKTYYKAKLECDNKTLKTLVSDPDNIPAKKKLKEEAQFFQEYRNLKCYVKKGFQEGTYIVFTYYEIKITNIDTLVPAFTENYIITQKDGSLKLVYGKLDKQTSDYYYARKQDADVLKLTNSIDKKLKKALKKDKTLKTFYNNLLEIHTKKSGTGN